MRYPSIGLVLHGIHTNSIDIEAFVHLELIIMALLHRFQVNQMLKNKVKEEQCHKLINLEQLNQNIL